jgi:MoxR-like ATPase
MKADRDKINDEVRKEAGFVSLIKGAMKKIIVGQDHLLERILVGLLADGHLLVESVPGLAKTLSITTLSDCISATFQRVQFTPDLLPADIVGTLIYNAGKGTFEVKKGPIFANIVLADEINRSPGKVQAALLEAMQERQVTIGNTRYKLEAPFLVMATQNPIDQEGTYPLPEAQVDRFMMKINITYPSEAEETEIITRMGRVTGELSAEPVINGADILRARKVVDTVYLDDKIKEYIIRVVFATRFPEKYGLKGLQPLIQMGASPRASIAFIVASKAYAFINSRGFVTPQDIKDIGSDILRHRIMRSYEAEAEEITAEDIIKQIFDKVDIP